MNEMEAACFQIIASCGQAKSEFIQAVEAAKNGNFEEAETLMHRGNEAMVEGHKPHAVLLHQEADGRPVAFSLLLMHAEDQMTSAEQFREMAKQLIEVYYRFDKDQH